MNKRILVVDDEADIVELIAYNLREAGLEVIVAGDGNAAVSKAHDLRPDLILLDLMLPEMDGLTVCEMLRSMRTTHRIPIIIVTAWADEQSRIVGLELGADDYIVKPFSPRELVLRVNNVLRRR
jgi:DNA-binding response OmpR family regulator